MRGLFHHPSVKQNAVDLKLGRWHHLAPHIGRFLRKRGFCRESTCPNRGQAICKIAVLRTRR